MYDACGCETPSARPDWVEGDGFCVDETLKTRTQFPQAVAPSSQRPSEPCRSRDDGSRLVAGAGSVGVFRSLRRHDGVDCHRSGRRREERLRLNIVLALGPLLVRFQQWGAERGRDRRGHVEEHSRSFERRLRTRFIATLPKEIAEGRGGPRRCCVAVAPFQDSQGVAQLAFGLGGTPSLGNDQRGRDVGARPDDPLVTIPKLPGRG